MGTKTTQKVNVSVLALLYTYIFIYIKKILKIKLSAHYQNSETDTKTQAQSVDAIFLQYTSCFQKPVKRIEVDRSEVESIVTGKGF